MEIQTPVDTYLWNVITFVCDLGHTAFHQRLTLPVFSRLLKYAREFARLIMVLLEWLLVKGSEVNDTEKCDSDSGI